jgi:DNA-binding phage protein
MMETMTAPYDVAEFLETPEEVAAYLEACIQEAVSRQRKLSQRRHQK